VYLEHLTSLDLRHNRLKGQLTSFVVDYFPSGPFKYLDLSSNRFTGSIPSALAGLFNISANSATTSSNETSSSVHSTYLNISSNLLQGSISSSLCSLNNITFIAANNLDLSCYKSSCWNFAYVDFGGIPQCPDNSSSSTSTSKITFSKSSFISTSARKKVEAWNTGLSSGSNNKGTRTSSGAGVRVNERERLRESERQREVRDAYLMGLMEQREAKRNGKSDEL
jgi:hypothetical protein